ncbi:MULTISPECIES: hypothetical protein [unclassified Microcoleus]|uniref:hypothetical protein n=1 Tax=unclassified Microcoleus TaxID=2642155 RepID=UPI002FD65027
MAGTTFEIPGQEALLTDSGICDSAELRYPMQAHPRQTGSFAGDGVCGFWQCLESQGKRGFGSEYFAVSGIAAAVTVRGERWNARRGWAISLIDIKSSNRSLQERGLYFSV